MEETVKIPKLPRVNVEVSESLKQDLKVKAAKENKNLKQVIHQLLIEWLAK